jgi:hypothetical protein
MAKVAHRENFASFLPDVYPFWNSSKSETNGGLTHDQSEIGSLWSLLNRDVSRRGSADPTGTRRHCDRKIYDSTTAPGLCAKPVIDIMPVVTQITQVDPLTPLLEALGYIPREENGIPGRRFFSNGAKPSAPTTCISSPNDIRIFSVISPSATTCGVISPPRNAVATWKGNWLNNFHTTFEKYIEGKNNLVKELERRILSW